MKTTVLLLILASLAACSSTGSLSDTYAITAKDGDKQALHRDIARCQFNGRATWLICMEDRGYQLVPK